MSKHIWSSLAILAVASACGSRSGLLAGEAGRDGRELGVDPAPVSDDDPPQTEPSLEPPVPEQRGCIDITRSYASVPATVMLLIDQSGSMDERFGAGTRWSVLRDAITNETDGLLTWLDASASVGLMLYTSLDGFAFGRQCPMLTRVQSTLGNAQVIRDAYRQSEPLFDGDTPTGESIDAAVRELVRAPAGSPKYILLLTDGLPDTCAQPDPQNGLQAAVDAAARAFEQGVRVYPVGVSPDLARGSLQRMANAGAGQPSRLVYGTDPDAEEPLSASTDPRELARQLKGVIGDVRSCSIELDEAVGSERAFQGELELDGQPLIYEDEDGWRFIDDDTLEIRGAACRRILDDGERLIVHFPCLEPVPR